MSAPEPIPELIRLLKNNPDIWKQGGAGHKEVVIARAPGRLDVMGGISDSTGGLVAVMPLEAAAAVAVQRRDDRTVTIKTFNEQASGGETQSRVEFSLDDFYGTAALLPNETLRDLFTGGRHWAAYIAGAFPMLAKYKKITRRTHGANIACFSNVPFGVGLGSSAAVACAALSALTAAFQMIMDPLEIAVLAQKLEHQIVGTPRGIMDQAASVLGKADQLLLMQCQPHEVKGYLPVPPGYMFAGINTGVPPPIVGPGYRNARVAAVMAQTVVARAYQDFGNKKDPTRGYLANVPVEMYERYFRAILPEKVLGKTFVQTYGPVLERVAEIDPDQEYELRVVADYHVRENARTAAFVEHLRGLSEAKEAGLKKSRAILAGKLMHESHEAYARDLHLASAATDLLVDLVMKRGAERAVFGARVMGVGGGGTVAVFAEDSAEVRQGLQEIAAEYQKESGKAAQVLMGSSAGAAEFTPMKVPLAKLIA